jgi:trans-2,3-dihydro-3-hydroxyanthranilate isomerase
VLTGRRLAFVQVDVFTDRLFGGNPLAVFLEGISLSDEQMQAITREMNLSETIFLLPPERDDCDSRLRIFTPGRELPFAGHSTIGTAWVLRQLGICAPRSDRLVLQEEIGPVPVRFDGDMIWTEHGQASFEPELAQRSEIAASLDLAEDDLLEEAPIQTGSTGNAFLYVPLATKEAVDRARLDHAAYERAMGGAPLTGVFVFALDLEAGPNRVYSRMLPAASTGIGEDPATGSASGPLGAYLVGHGLVPAAERVEIVSEQGTKMGRQSFVHIVVERESGRIEVGGQVVPVLEGTLTLPIVEERHASDGNAV